MTTLDITFIRRLILGISTTLPKGAWQFVPSDFVFLDSNAPWNPAPDPARHYLGLASDQTGQDFIGIRLGDVNNSWTPAAAPGPQSLRAHDPDPQSWVALGNLLSPSGMPSPQPSPSRWERVSEELERIDSGTPSRSSSSRLPAVALAKVGWERVPEGQVRVGLESIPPTSGPRSLSDEATLLTSHVTDPAVGIKKVVFELPAVRVPGGGTIEVPLKVSGFDKVTSFQFTLGWNPRLIRFEGLTNDGLTDLQSSNFNLSNTDVGRLVCSWDDVLGMGQSLGDGSVLLRLKFSAIDTHSAVSPVRFLSSPAASEIAVDSVLTDAAIQGGSVWIGSGPEDVRLLTPALVVGSEADQGTGSVELSVPSVMGLTYTLEFADSLSEPLWRTLKGFSGNGERMVISDLPSNSGQRFYRLRAMLDLGSGDNDMSVRD